MKMKKRIITICTVLVMVLVLVSACGRESVSDKGKEKNLTIAYQGGIAYAPVHIMETKKLIEKNYDGNIKVSFVKLNSGSAINEGIIGGTIDVGCLGLPPAIIGVSKGVPYKAITSLCSQPSGLMSNDNKIVSLRDITPSDKIAIVSLGSLQHILLAMAADKALGDAHALDNNVQRMSHAEGMASLESGTVKMHLTSPPFLYQERAMGKYTELKELRESWPGNNTFILAMGLTSLEKDPQLFEAIKKSFQQAIDFINTNKEETIQIEAKYLDISPEMVGSFLNQPGSEFFSEIRGSKTMADFMSKAGFIEKPVDMEKFSFPGVTIVKE